MVPIGMIAQIAGTALTGMKSARDKKLLVKDQKAKAQELINKANSVVTKKATDDPAYKMKAFLAQSGVPGYEQYAEGIDNNTEDQVIAASGAADSGFGLESFASALEGSANNQKRGLDIMNATFLASQKNQLASAQKSMQDTFDAQANKEREDFNSAASSYEQSSTLNKSAANEQIAATVGTVGNQVGEVMGGFGGSGNVGMGALSSMFGNTGGFVEGNSEGSFKTDVPNISMANGESGELAQKLVDSGKAANISDAMRILKTMGF